MQQQDIMTKDQIQVFISRKEKDRETAQRIKRQLSLYAADRLTFFTSEDIPKGDKWKPTILEKLSEADLLILLFTDPSTSWDWCLYEVGVFTTFDPKVQKPIVCLHSPRINPPGPLMDVQAVKVEKESVEDFLKKFYGTSQITRKTPPLSKTLAGNKDTIGMLADFICNEFKPLTGPNIYYNRRILLTVKPENLKADVIPANSEVESDRLTLEIFRLLQPTGRERNWKWGKLEKMMKDDGQGDWISEFSEAIYCACQGEVLRPIRSKLRSLSSGKEYRPNINQRYKNPDGTSTLEVLFIHQPSGDEVTLPISREEI